MPAPVVPHPGSRPTSVLGRAGHTLLHWWPARQVPPRPNRDAQLQALLAVLDDAVAAQRLADQVVAACGEPGPVTDSVARDGAQQLSTFNHLAQRLRELTVDADLAQLRERAARLLAYHMWMIHESLRLAFSFQLDNSRVEAARLRVNGLGAPADALRELRDDIRLLAAGARGEEVAR
jgi:hypothetical protein